MSVTCAAVSTNKDEYIGLKTDAQEQRFWWPKYSKEYRYRSTGEGTV